MTCRQVFIDYNRLQRKVETALKEASETLDPQDPVSFGRVEELTELRKRCFPTKEEAIAMVHEYMDEREL